MQWSSKEPSATTLKVINILRSEYRPRKMDQAHSH
jgi:hypothetical protein